MADAEGEEEADDELDDYDEIELDDEEAAQRVAYEVDQVGEEDEDEDDGDVAEEKDEEYEADTDDSDDSGGHAVTLALTAGGSLAHSLCVGRRERGGPAPRQEVERRLRQ